MMGLYLGTLIRALYLFAPMNLRVLSVAYGLAFLSRQESSKLVTLFSWLCLYQKESSPKVVGS